MAFKVWKPVKEYQSEFAGAPYYVAFALFIDMDQSAPCPCKVNKGVKVKIEVKQILGKNRKPAPYHSAVEVKKAVLERFAHGLHRCFECLQQPPFAS